MKIHVARDECAGHGRCAMVNEKLFPLDEDGFSAVDVEEVPPGLEADAQRAVDACPSRVITLTD